MYRVGIGHVRMCTVQRNTTNICCARCYGLNVVCKHSICALEASVRLNMGIGLEVLVVW